MKLPNLQIDQSQNIMNDTDGSHTHHRGHPWWASVQNEGTWAWVGNATTLVQSTSRDDELQKVHPDFTSV